MCRYRSLDYLLQGDHRLLKRSDGELYYITDDDLDRVYGSGISVTLVSPFINVQQRYRMNIEKEEWIIPSPEDIQKVMEIYDHMQSSLQSVMKYGAYIYRMTDKHTKDFKSNSGD